MSTLKKMLVLEDDACCVTLLKHRITREWPSSSVVHVSNKNDYAKALAENHFDLIVSDHSIPNFSGMQALSLASKECPETPFMFVSGSISDEMAVESLQAGAVDYILKDRPARLIPAIKRALDMAEAGSHRIEYETLVNSVDGIVWQADQASMRFIFVSKQAEHILGYPIEFWTEEPDFWQSHIHPEDKEMAVQHCKRLSSERPRSDFEYRMIAADGRVVWLRDMVSIRMKKNCAPLVQGIMVDVTQNKEAEQKIKEVQWQLEETNKDLVRRNQEIQNFYHVLSHELKTPLTAAREFVSLVMDGLAGPLNKTQSEYLGIARESCNQLRVCINDMLDTTRIETGKLSMAFASMDLGEIGRRIVTALQPKASECNIHLTFAASPFLSPIIADENRITQVIINLIENAFKFTSMGGRVCVEITEAIGRDDFIRVSVTDTGRGIPKDEQDSIFDRLYQIKTGDASSQKGIGLGLYLCRELVWLHGGVIWVKSEVGRGSVFTFMLPKTQKRHQADVLVMDDDPVILETVAMMLSTEYNVRTAQDGSDGLKEMRKKVPDIVVMDLSMPHVDGVEVLKGLRENWPTVPIIVHTAFSNGDIMKRAMEYSPFTLLSKPSGLDSLLRAVRFLCLGVQRDSGEETRIVDKSRVFIPKMPEALLDTGEDPEEDVIVKTRVS